MSRLFFTELRNSSLLQDHPQAAGDLIGHAMVGHTGPFYGCHEAVSTFEKLKSSALVSETSLNAVREGLLRLGCIA